MSVQTAILDYPETEYILPGNRLCAGCGVSIAYRFILKALGQKTIVSVPACCVTILHGIYPKTPIIGDHCQYDVCERGFDGLRAGGGSQGHRKGRLEGAGDGRRRRDVRHGDSVPERGGGARDRLHLCLL